MSDFDRKLDELRRGTDGLTAPEGFDAALNAKLVAAAALPPAVAGAALSWGVRLLIGVVAFAGAGGAVWWANCEPTVPPEQSSGTPPAVEAARPPKPHAEERRAQDRLASGVTQRSTPPGSPALLGTALQEPVDGGAISADGGPTAAGSEATVASVISVSETITVATARARSCGREVDRIDLVSRGSAMAAAKRAGADEAVVEMLIARADADAAWLRTGRALVVGQLVFNGGPGLTTDVAGKVHVSHGWFAFAGPRRGTVELVVNEYRPVVLGLPGQGDGYFDVGRVQLEWVGNKREDERSLKVVVQGARGNPARVRLFPMACDGAKWQPSWMPAVDVPLSSQMDTVITHLSATKYRVAAYAPGVSAGWVDATTYDTPLGSAVVTLAPERPVRVEYTIGHGDQIGPKQATTLALSQPWQASPEIELHFKPGREPGQLCIDVADSWVAHTVNLALGKAKPPSLDEHLGITRCIDSSRTMVFERSSPDWVAALFYR